MTQLSTMLQPFHGLVVAAFVALASLLSSAQPSTLGSAQLSTLSAALACVEPPLGDRTAALSLQSWQYADAQAALDAEESEPEGDQEVPPLDANDLGRPSSERLPIFFAAQYGVAPVAGWSSALLSSYHPRGPPIH